MIFGITIVSIVVGLAIPVIIIGVVILATAETPRRGATLRMNLPRARLATGEIDQAEFLVRMRALHDGDDRDIT